MKRLFIIALLVLVLPLVLSSQMSLPKHWARSNIEVNFDIAKSVYAADLDGDGDNDVLGASYGLDEIAWWENDGNGNFGAKHIISCSFGGAWGVYAADLDNDGDIDILGAAYGDNQIACWENDGGGGPLGIYDHPKFTKHVIAANFTNAIFIYAIDLDNDNDKDVIATGWNTDSPTWWENEGELVFTEHSIPDGGVMDFSAADLDRDGDVDIVGTDEFGDKVYWFENDGGTPPSFIRHLFAIKSSPAPIHTTDLDSDGDADILLGGEYDHYLIWYENRQDLAGEDPIVFTAHVISYAVPICATSIYAIDLDNDMDKDFLVTYSILRGYDDIGLIWFENNGSENFSAHIVGHDFYGSSCGYAANIDNNNYADLLGASCIRETICWWRNHLGDVSISSRPAGGENPSNNTSQNVMGTHNPGVAEGSSDIPGYFSFSPRNNPAKGKAIFSMSLPEASLITLRIYDASGRLIATPVNGMRSSGNHTITWTPSTNGVYFYSLKSPWKRETGKILFIR